MTCRQADLQRLRIEAACSVRSETDYSWPLFQVVAISIRFCLSFVIAGHCDYRNCLIFAFQVFVLTYFFYPLYKYCQT